MRQGFGGPVLHLLFLAILWIFYAAVLLWPGTLAISGIEGDILHVIDAAARINAGALPHRDFSTPLGLLSFLPVAWGLAAGLGPGQAMLAANLGVALLLLPALFWLRLTRTGGAAAVLLALWVMAEAVALVHDSNLSTVTFALHYNRWGWAVLTILAVLLAVPEREGRSRNDFGDGLVLGLGLAVLALVKVTYFAALVLPVLVWMLGQRRFRAGLVAGAAGLSVAAAVTVLAGGFGFWAAYLGDLLLVAGSEARAQPGYGLAEVISGPAYFLGSALLLVSVIALRQAGLAERGLMLFLLAPGLIYVTWQNWANAPVWLVLLTFLLLEARGAVAEGARLFGQEARALLAALALLSAASAAPYAGNMLASPFRHLTAERDQFAPPLRVAGWDDLLFLSDRGARIRADVPLGTAPEASDLKTRADQEPTPFMGRDFPPCHTTAGIVAQMMRRAEALAPLPEALAGGATVTADLLNAGWMFTGGRPFPGGAPWYYRGTTGLDRADWLIVPQCPVSSLARAEMLRAIEAAGWRWEEALADEVLVVYRRIRD